MFLPDPIAAKPGQRTITLIVFLVTTYFLSGIIILAFWWMVAKTAPEKDPTSVIATFSSLVGGAGTMAGGLYTWKSIKRQPGDPNDPKGGVP